MTIFTHGVKKLLYELITAVIVTRSQY